MKNRWSKALALAGVTVLLSMSSGNLYAQGRGNFDPEEMRERMMTRMREQLEVTDDAEWKIIQARVEKVMEARRDAQGGMGFGAFGRPGGRGDRGDRQNGNGGGAGGRRGGPGGLFGGEPSPEAEALQKALEAKAPADDIKAKLAKVREARKEKEAALEKAQASLKEVLSSRQEAQAVLMGLLR